MQVRFYRRAADAERNAGRVMCEKTMQDHTSAGVAPSVACDVATDKDKAAHEAEWLAFVASEAPAEAAESEPDPAPAVASKRSKR